MTALAERQFTMEDQSRFARVSMDMNPVHIDALAARRTQVGQCIVHGMHTVLWALESVAEAWNWEGCDLLGVAAHFHAPVFLDRQVVLEVISRKEDQIELVVRCGEDVHTSISIEIASGDRHRPRVARDPTVPIVSTPRIRTLAELAGAEGEIELVLSSEGVAVFSSATSTFGAHAVATLTALSRLVGMECPGLHSLFTSFSVKWKEGAAQALGYRVIRTEERFSLVNLELHGAVTGQLQTFLRPGQTEIAATRDLDVPYGDEEFLGRRALIIGGSRGLGAATAQLLARGGAGVAITYHSGRKDAEQIASDLQPHANRVEVFQYDVAESDALTKALTDVGFWPDMLFFFATPKILHKKGRRFDYALFSRYCKYYVDGFARTTAAVVGLRGTPVMCFYPSTVFLDDPANQHWEYVAAKAAGESLCRQYERVDSRVKMVIERLPRTQTDQTLSLIGDAGASPVDIMLPIVVRASLTLLERPHDRR